MPISNKILGLIVEKSFYIITDKGSNQAFNNILFEKREEHIEYERF